MHDLAPARVIVLAFQILAFQKSLKWKLEVKAQTPQKPERSFPPGTVLDSGPDLADYAKGGISNWRDFLATIAVVRSMRGICPSAWEAAQAAMGKAQAAIVVAAILQERCRDQLRQRVFAWLDTKSGGVDFSAGPMLTALIGGRKRERKRA